MRSPLRALALAAILAAAGCGGDSADEERAGADSTPTPTATAREETIALDEYIAKGDAICRKGGAKARKRLTPLVRKAGSEPTVAEVMRINQAALKLSEPMHRRLAMLPEPDERQDDVEKMLVAVDESTEELQQAIGYYQVQDTKGMKAAILRNREKAREYAKHAKAVGFKACGKEITG
jgi:hypothetical protein